MSVSEKKKASNAKWDKENMFTLGCRIRKEQAAAFKDVCAAAGITANTALKDYVLECIGAQALVKPSDNRNDSRAEAAQDALERVSGSGATPIPDGTETPSEAAQSGGEGGITL